MWGVTWVELASGELQLIHAQDGAVAIVQPLYKTGMWTYVVYKNGEEDTVGACEGKSQAMWESKKAYQKILKEKRKSCLELDGKF